MGCSNLEAGGLTPLEGGGISSDGGQQRVDVPSHVRVVIVEWFRVGDLGHHLGLILVAIARSWVEASEPRLSSSAVTNELRMDVERAQIALGIGEII